MRNSSIRRVALAVACASACALAGPAGAAKKSRTPLTSSVKELTVSPQELRIRVRALIRPLLGAFEQAADRASADTSDPVVKRGCLVWKIETTTTLLSALLRSDPVLAIADAWAYAIQVRNYVERPEVKARYGEFAGRASDAAVEVQDELRAFSRSIQEGLDVDTFESKLRAWAEAHPIEGALFRRPAIDSAVAAIMAAASKGGALKALGGLGETTADVTARMDLYTMYLPRLMRWEAELGIDDVTGGIDAASLVAELKRFTDAADRIAGVAETTPELVDKERVATIEALRGERIATLQDIETMRKRFIVDAGEILDKQRVATIEAFHSERNATLQDIETMRERLIEDARAALDHVVDHAFIRGIELLLIAAALAGIGMVLYAKLLR